MGMAHEIFKCIGDEYIFAITDTEYLDDEGVDEHEITQEEEKELINQKTELEQFFIHKYRDIFSESLSPYRFLQTKQKKTKQNKKIQYKTKQKKTKQNKTKTKQNKTKQNKAK